MAPEQASGRTDLIGPATDVYALGAILYELIGGRPPFKGLTRSMTLEMVRTLPPPRLPAGQAKRRLDLEAICLKCLAKDPGRRYASAAELAHDLGEWRRERRTVAGAQRKTRRAFLGAALAGSGLGLGGLGVWLYSRGRDPAEMDLESIREAELERGRPVVLLGENGEPAWSRWCIGERRATAGLEDVRVRETAFTLNAWKTTALLELLRDPRHDRYRLRAEVQHQASAAMGEIGLFLAHETHQTPAGPLHIFTQLSFDDINDGRQKFIDMLKNPPVLPPGVVLPPPPIGNRLSLICRVYGRECTDWNDDYSSTAGSWDGFKPAGHAGPWRSLVVEVTPGEVRVFWDGAPAARFTVSPARITDLAANAVPELKDKHPEFPGVRATFNPRGSLGLYAWQGSASFRSVVVEPMPAGA
jgi:hypothetical protein